MKLKIILKEGCNRPLFKYVDVKNIREAREIVKSYIGPDIFKMHHFRNGYLSVQDVNINYSFIIE